MDKNKTKELSDILRLYSDRAISQISNNVNQWVEFSMTAPEHKYYRIKEEPKLIPFTFEDNLLGKIVVYSDESKAMITAQKKDGVYIGGSLNLTSYSNLMTFVKFEDGSPCGKYINE